MASKKVVEAKLRGMIDRLDQAGDDVRENLARALPRRRYIQIDLTDLQTSYWAELSEGRMGKLHEGEAPSPDIWLRAASDDLTAALDGDRNLLALYLSGKLQVAAGLQDLMALRKLG